MRKGRENGTRLLPAEKGGPSSARIDHLFLMASDDVTRLLAEIRDAGPAGAAPDAVARLLALVYAELRKNAARHLRAERPDHTLQPTALVHEVYLRLLAGDGGASSGDVKASGGPAWQNRAHFYGIAARCMRQILVDHARERNALKRGNGRVLQPLTMAIEVEAPEPGHLGQVDVSALDDALTRLAEVDPFQAQVVELRFFGGLNVDEAAEALGVSGTTVKRAWRVARAWLRRELER